MGMCKVCGKPRATFTVFCKGKIVTVHSKCSKELENREGEIKVYGNVAIIK